ncbi:aquaporin NIP6-1 [Selaginella moellendorffii]|uniref:aquaporin NIP6-1 n=1 Tax=Selaginella moellendorffii TaxID=88036 RepID=UPI000D1C2EE7|nr:aquaporin NIP6-1 [Selaginella moellendorffii]|eukprot:XP_002974523.2 aquaporin NIP6-1 [Selaginella moellendorffii]
MPLQDTFPNSLDLEQGDNAIIAVGGDKIQSRPRSLELLKKVLAEFLGSLVLLLGCAGTAILASKPSNGFGIHGISAGAALTVMIVIFSTGHISGAHVNPAVSLAFASLGRFPWIQVPLYSGAQFLGSVCASFMLNAFFQGDPNIHAGVTVPSNTEWQSFAVELVISAILMFVVTAVATDPHAIGDSAAVAVAATVYLNNLLASAISGASMNPIRTFGPALAAGEYRGLWVYFFGPILGTQLGAGFYTLIRSS